MCFYPYMLVHISQHRYVLVWRFMTAGTTKDIAPHIFTSRLLCVLLQKTGMDSNDKKDYVFDKNGDRISFIDKKQTRKQWKLTIFL